MSDVKHHETPPPNDVSAKYGPAALIDIPGDQLAIDELFCDWVLGGATTRTAHRYQAEGLPFVYVKGKKYRPLGEGRKWLADRIQRRGEAPKHRRQAR